MKNMISLPDFRQRQILYLDASDIAGCEISLRNENILIKEGSKPKNKMPIAKLIAVFITGDMTFTSKLIQKLMRAGVSTYLLKRNLEVYATIGAYAEGNYLLRAKQYALSDDQSLTIAKSIVRAKVQNQITLLRNIKIKKLSNKTIATYKRDVFAQIELADNLASLRGIEGSVSKDFFGNYFGTIGWYKRVPRGKIDPNNILLDMGYSFLFNFVDSLLRVYGFDTYKGIYHQLFFQRKSLSCDMMEPFRCIIDRALVKAHNLGQFDKKDFTFRKDKYYLSYKNNGKYVKIFLTEILRNKEDIYNYIRGNYYHILNGEGELPKFKIR